MMGGYEIRLQHKDWIDWLRCIVSIILFNEKSYTSEVHQKKEGSHKYREFTIYSLLIGVDSGHTVGT